MTKTLVWGDGYIIKGWNTGFTSKVVGAVENGRSRLLAATLVLYFCDDYFTGNGKITPDRISRLEAIGFEWDPQRAQWNLMFDKLKQFKEEVGHCKVPKVRSTSTKTFLFIVCGSADIAFICLYHLRDTRKIQNWPTGFGTSDWNMPTWRRERDLV
jgi:hypothetical protein